MSPDRAIRRWDRAYLILYILYFSVGLIARIFGWIHSFDAAWFVEAARRVLDGSFDVYSFKTLPELAPPEGATYAYSPLMAVTISPFVGLADGLGWGQAWAERLIAVPLLLADVLAMAQLRRLVRSLRPAADENLLFLGIFITLCLTAFWAVTAYKAHDEGLVLLFLLLTLRFVPQNLLLAGLCAGLALGAKQNSLLELIPIGFVLLAGGARTETSRTIAPEPGRSAANALLSGAIFGGAALAVFAILVLPAAIRNPAATWYALVTFPTRLEMGGPGLPVWIDNALRAALPTGDFARAHQLLVSQANTAMAGTVVLAQAIGVWWARRRGAPLSLIDIRLLALIAFGSVVQIVLGKWVGHYYQLALALVFLWDITRITPLASARDSAHEVRPFPWISIGSAIAFRSIAAFSVLWLRDLLTLAIFGILGIATILGAWEKRQVERADVQSIVE